MTLMLPLFYFIFNILFIVSCSPSSIPFSFSDLFLQYLAFILFFVDQDLPCFLWSLRIKSDLFLTGSYTEYWFYFLFGNDIQGVNSIFLKQWKVLKKEKSTEFSRGSNLPWKPFISDDGHKRLNISNQQSIEQLLKLKTMSDRSAN